MVMPPQRPPLSRTEQSLPPHAVDPSEAPVWCDGERCLEPDPRDRFHERSGPVLNGVTRILERHGLSARASAARCEVHPVLVTSATEPDEVWISVELGEVGPGITLSVETARRLLPILHDLVAAAS